MPQTKVLVKFIPRFPVCDLGKDAQTLHLFQPRFSVKLESGSE